MEHPKARTLRTFDTPPAAFAAYFHGAPVPFIDLATGINPPAISGSGN